MAFQDHHQDHDHDHHLSQEIPLHVPRYSHHHNPSSAAVFHSILPDHHPSPDDKLNNSALHHHHHQWLPTQSQPSPPDNNNNNNSDHSGGGGGDNSNASWEKEKCKADILNHPLYDQLLSAHVSCLRIATPVDQLPKIDAQLAQSHQVVAKYSVLGHPLPLDDKDLDHFMTHYVLLLSSFKEQLQQHVRVHAMEAVMACWELEQSLQSLTGVAPGEGTGATMSDDDEDQADSEMNLFDESLDGPDSMGFGPLVPTESERSLMERVKQELKHELKQGYKEKIFDIREEILRKRRAGKLPGDTTSMLKAWWQSHSKWPYPTEEDKARLVQETGLQLKQINNWFINQRKRNWHSNPSSSTSQKSKRKRMEQEQKIGVAAERYLAINDNDSMPDMIRESNVTKPRSTSVSAEISKGIWWIKVSCMKFFPLFCILVFV
ncbi:homeobox protein knotted-1-like 3 [Perilla frutescens var. frutescens]|nr:homeobox protein knotted-1-like 3 [Perilla frutescens var. frutescens]